MSDDVVTAHLLSRIAELERRLEGMLQPAPVHPGSTDPAKGTTRLRLGGTDEDPFLSAPIPYAQVAGALKVHSPPSDGQQMVQLAFGGDFGQAIAIPMTWSDHNQSPSQSGDEHVITLGEARVEFRSGDVLVRIPKIRFECGGSIFELTAQGLRLVTGGVTSDWTGDGHTQAGGAITHDGHSIDKTHVHTDVTPGPAMTGPPP